MNTNGSPGLQPVDLSFLIPEAQQHRFNDWITSSAQAYANANGHRVNDVLLNRDFRNDSIVNYVCMNLNELQQEDFCNVLLYQNYTGGRFLQPGIFQRMKRVREEQVMNNFHGNATGANGRPRLGAPLGGLGTGFMGGNPYASFGSPFAASGMDLFGNAGTPLGNVGGGARRGLFKDGTPQAAPGAGIEQAGTGSTSGTSSGQQQGKNGNDPVPVYDDDEFSPNAKTDGAYVGKPAAKVPYTLRMLVNQGITFDNDVHLRPLQRTAYNKDAFEKYGSLNQNDVHDVDSLNVLFYKKPFSFYLKNTKNRKFSLEWNSVPTIDELECKNEAEYAMQMCKLFDLRPDQFANFFNDSTITKNTYDADDHERKCGYLNNLCFMGLTDKNSFDFKSMDNETFMHALGMGYVSQLWEAKGALGPESTLSQLMRNLGLDPSKPEDRDKVRKKDFWLNLDMSVFKDSIGFAFVDQCEEKARARASTWDEDFMENIGKKGVNIMDMYRGLRNGHKGNMTGYGYLFNHVEPLSYRRSLWSDGIRLNVESNEKQISQFGGAKHSLLKNGEASNKKAVTAAGPGHVYQPKQDATMQWNRTNSKGKRKR